MTDRAEALRQRLLTAFRLEADEHLCAIAGELDAAAAEPSTAGEYLERAFRAMHTLKGAARSVGLTEFEAAAQRCEAQLSAAVKGELVADATFVRRLQDASDVLAGHLAGTVPIDQLATIAVVSAAAPAKPAPSPEPVAPASATVAAERPTASEAIRVETERLDRLTVLAENLLSPKLAAAAHTARALALVEEIRDARERRASSNELGLLETHARELAVGLRSEQRALATSVDELYEELLRVRLTPAETILEGFPRMIRDLCRETGKEVDWESRGAQLEIDRKVLGLVKDPLLHMVRNAVDHGIEAPEARVAAGKPRRGTIRVTVTPIENGRISIEVADDGRGFALDALREAAVRSRVSSAEAVASMSDAEVAEFAFSAGVSTSPVITTISGHGRGLAIVRETIERIEGRISTHSTPGAGTVIRLELPASIVTYRALLVSAAGKRYLVPIDAVERAFPLDRAWVAEALAAGQITLGGSTLRFGHLRDVLGLANDVVEEDDRRELPCLQLRSGERRGVLLVDDVIGEHEVVVKELRPPLRRVRNVLATGLLGSGDLVLVLRPLDLVLGLGAATARPRQAPAPLRAQRVLVVDDSLTTRTMERSLFEAAGYTVAVAVDGQDAWERLQAEEVDLVVSDVDMPRMDGIDLCSRIRADAKLAALPIVLITARETHEDEARALRAGANAYVLKSSFDQTALLEIVGRFR